MKKELRKEIEKKITAAIINVLPSEHKAAIEKSSKHINEASRLVARKFSKAQKAIEKEKKRVQEKARLVKKVVRKKKAAVVKKKK